VHTNENQNKKDTTVRMGKPGEQVAVNRTLHNNMVLHENESGEYYPVISPLPQPTLVRGEYHPIGNSFQYPKAWGRKYAAATLLEHKIKVQQDILENATIELAKLQRCLSDVQQWSDND
jgi:hypothetical protein